MSNIILKNNFYEIFTTWPKLVSKLKMLNIYWNLAHIIFEVWQSVFQCQKDF